MGVALGGLVAREEIALESLAGKRVAVDGNNALYQFLAIIRGRDGTPLLDSKGRVTSHLSGLFYRTARLVEAKVKPIYVFDGEPPHMKRRTLDERREIRAEAAEKWAAALKEGAIAEARMHAMASSRLTREMVEESKKLLGLMGIPSVQAPQEGEAQAAAMCMKGDVWASASQDYDSLLLGTPKLVRNLTMSGRRKLPRRNEYVDVVPELIELDKTLAQYGMSRAQLIWLGILVGTDFNKGVRGIGPKKALKIVIECDSLSEAVQKAGGAELFEVEPAEVEQYFLKPKVSEDYVANFGQPDVEGLVEFMANEHDFSKERIEGAAKAFADAMAESTQQQKLGEWFG